VSYLALARQAAARSLSTTRTSRAAGAHPPLADLLSMPLTDFARADWVLEVRVAGWPETLFFVPAVQDAEALCREGVGRERVWTAKELHVVLDGPPLAAEDLRVIMIARREFAGEVVQVQPRRS